MNKQKILLLPFILCLLFFKVSAFAQDAKPCGTSEMTNKYFENHPDVKKQYLEDEQLRMQEDKIAFANNYKTTLKAAGTIYTIPVVFHILHQGGAENISDAQILDQMRILNEDFRKLNPDTSKIVTAFKSIAADCEIQFQLAKKDPLGNCTKGIDRIYTSATNTPNNPDDAKLNQWPRNKYLNIWVVKKISSGAAGYAYYPATAAFNPSIDGIMILSNYIGSIGTGSPSRSRSLTHEIGHYLNLTHTWGDNNSPGDVCGDDYISDTPITKGHTTCQLSDSYCTTGVVENVQNYMEYSYCSNMFTAGQKTRMINTLSNTFSQRNNLWTPSNLTITGVTTPSVLCASDFNTNSSDNIICQGESLSYSDLSWNGNPTSWLWTFEGGSPSTSTDPAPTITYNTPGIFDVTLRVANASGSATITKSDYVSIRSNTATQTNSFYTEGFEWNAIPNVNWNVYNSNEGTNTWVQTNAAAASGSYSVYIKNDPSYDTYEDELISPPIDMSVIKVTSPKLSYKFAHAKKTSASSDKLQVYVSSDCGNTWFLRQTLVGDGLSTAGVNSTSSFLPSPGEWKDTTINLNLWASATSLLIKFKFTSNGGNNIFIDDINIKGPVGIDELSNNLHLNVFPNPVEESTVLSFDLNENNNVEIIIYDIFGHAVSSVFKGKPGIGKHEYPISKNIKLASGLYFVSLRVGNERSIIQKLILN